MKVLLTHGYFLALDPHERELMRPFPPLGIQYLVAYLLREGVEASWWDSTFAAGPEAFPSVLQQRSPQLVGFYGHTITRPTTVGLVAQALDAGCRVIAGGPDPVQYLEDYFAMGVEVVVIGEGEETLAELVRHLQENQGTWNFSTLHSISGVAFSREGQVVKTSPRRLIRPLDSLPWPHRERSDLEAYFSAWRARHGQTAMSLTTSRGCPFHCAWCSKQVYGDTFRRRDPDAVIDELLALRKEYQPDQIWFVDDMFTLNRKWVERFCDRMVERNAVTPFYIIGRAETLDESILTRLARAGCYRIYVSAESGADHVLQAMAKGTSVAEIDRAGVLLRQAGIEMGVFVMLGYPSEEKPDILATRDLLRRLDPAVTLLSVAHPMKGTAFYTAVANEITGQSGGRLRFNMRHSPRLYDVAQRMIHADLARAKSRSTGLGQRVSALLRYAGWRGAFALVE